MGDVPSDIKSPGGTEDETCLASESIAVHSKDLSATISDTQHTQPANASHQSSPSGLTEQGQHMCSSSLKFSSMTYSLPAAHSQSSSFETHFVHQYPGQVHVQGPVHPILSIGPYPGQTPGEGVPYGVPFAPSYVSYTLAQSPGAAQGGGGGHYSPYVPSIHNPTMPNIGGQSPAYGAGLYYHPTYTAFGSGAQLPNRHQQPPSPAARHGSRATLHSFKNEFEKSATEEEYDVSKTIVDGSNPAKLTTTSPHAFGPALSPLSTPPISKTPRGPPRKPKQSGHALWVGNLPPGANVMDLKDYFSQGATHEIESVFLISKSNCAFVNYKSASACAAALTRFHDSRFQGVRLVCRHRKGFTAPGSGSAMTAAASRLRSEEKLDTLIDEPPVTEETDLALQPSEGSRSSDRYFIVKSLTVEDLELSKQSGIWATQTHNETNLNHAFETTDNVYLIFSANKSGEYFGYARMLSPISDDEELALELPRRPEPPPGGTDALDVIPTVGTSTAPKGRVIDDSARGSIFWEVESSEDENRDARSEKGDHGPPDEAEPDNQTFGKPFRIQWLSTERVPFHRTRGLRNPWNANREVKIARDGTEIEPTIGRQLLSLFQLP